MILELKEEHFYIGIIVALCVVQIFQWRKIETMERVIGQMIEDFKDVSKLEYITSSGLNFFIRSLTRIRNVGGEIILCGVQGNVEKLLKISKLNEIFTICPTIADGLVRVENN